MSAEGLDIDGYLRAIGLPQAQDWKPTVASPERLHRAHLDVFTFANITTALGGVPKLDLATLQQRMVDERRGGYCHEQV